MVYSSKESINTKPNYVSYNLPRLASVNSARNLNTFTPHLSCNHFYISPTIYACYCTERKLCVLSASFHNRLLIIYGKQWLTCNAVCNDTDDVCVCVWHSIYLYIIYTSNRNRIRINFSTESAILLHVNNFVTIPETKKRCSRLLSVRAFYSAPFSLCHTWKP